MFRSSHCCSTRGRMISCSVVRPKCSLQLKHRTDLHEISAPRKAAATRARWCVPAPSSPATTGSRDQRTPFSAASCVVLGYLRLPWRRLAIIRGRALPVYPRRPSHHRCVECTAAPLAELPPPPPPPPLPPFLPSPAPRTRRMRVDHRSHPHPPTPSHAHTRPGVTVSFTV